MGREGEVCGAYLLRRKILAPFSRVVELLASTLWSELCRSERADVIGLNYLTTLIAP